MEGVNQEGLIVLKQLPIIEEKLEEIRKSVEERVKVALALACTEDTVKEIKNVRASFNKEFKELEEQRKAVKEAIAGPYQQFMQKYGEIADVYRLADDTLKKNVAEVESGVKAAKEQEVRDYFEEYAKSRNMDIATFEDAKISVTLTASMRSLKLCAKSFVDKVCDELALIDTQEHKDEILYHYTDREGDCFLSANFAIQKVLRMHQKLDQMKFAEEEQAVKLEAETETVQKVEEALSAPTEEEYKEEMPEVKQETEDNVMFPTKFVVWGTLKQLKELKQFLVHGGYKYEQ